MSRLKLRILLICVFGVLISAAGIAEADWEPGDGHKMHYPQMPDPDGWDIWFGDQLADDWLCTETGPVSDVHFWYSWEGDNVGTIDRIGISIWSDDPCDGPGDYSKPDQSLWYRMFLPGEFTERHAGSGNQGWAQPYQNIWRRPDHVEYFQVNIADIADPFIQQQGTIYWLKVQMWPAHQTPQPNPGWKTSKDHWNDDAVWEDMDTGHQELIDPCTGESLDLAFVITGGPNNLKWAQYPDLSDYNSIDVDATTEGNWSSQILADDFNCTATGPITDIHIWGSWYEDDLPGDDDPNGVVFTLSIHADVPDPDLTDPDNWSMPGDVLWHRQFGPGEFESRLWAFGLKEGWFVPCAGADGYYEPLADTQCWRYDFYLDPGEFIQEGTIDNPVVYWLDVQAQPLDTDPNVRFGWKASIDHWNDDAVWVVGSEPYNGPWNELRYPFGHNFERQSIDLAFMITGEEEQVPPPDLDFGDAPDPNYPTLLANDGARHVIGGPYFCDALGGDSPDSEPDGQPHPWAMGDDIDADGDDEDGVTFPVLTIGVPATISLNVCGAGPFGAWVQIWIDYDGSESWEAAEMVYNANLTNGAYLVPVTAPAGSATGLTVARCRISTGGGLLPTGQASDGEVEDHRVQIDAPPGPKPPTPHLKWSQPPIEIDPNIWPPVYCGWDEPSWTTDPHGTSWSDNTAADDFRCLGTMPITSIHWWGSYVGWQEIDPPMFAPISGWLIRFYSNVPAIAGADPNYSHPEQLLREIQIDDVDRVKWEWVGYDEFPDRWPDTCFQYNVDLEPEEWFWQANFLQRTIDDVFWISIQAIYQPGADPIYPWGWKTRPWHWMDDAVRYECQVVDGATICRMWPIKDTIWGESYDLAFELDTDPNYIKWEQPYDSIHHWPHYEDEKSMAHVYRFTETKWAQYPDLEPGVSIDVDATDDRMDMWYPQVIADDFNCTSPTPITDIHLWTSWFNDTLPQGDANNVIFTLSIHDDIPKGAVADYSMPGDVRWWRQFHPGEFQSSIWATQLDEGWYSPCTDFYEQGVDTVCWKYDFYIDPAEAFLQEGTLADPKVYWLDVQAEPQASDPWIRFGWKTSMDHWNDDGVWTTGDEPYVGPWNELRYPPGHPYEFESIDLAFEITGESQQFVLDRMVADDWRCDANTPITAAVWWGSYIGYHYQPCEGPTTSC
jgi:hypothetical protein